MKMLLILCAGAGLDEVRRVIDAHEVHGYTEIPEVHGAGTSGRHMGTRAWPGTSSLIMAALEDRKVDALAAALRDLAGRCAPEEGLRVFVLPVEKMI